MSKHIVLVLCYGVMYAAFHTWTEKSIWGIALKKYLQEWRTGSLVHLILCALTVYTFAACGIVALALTLEAIGI